MDDMKDMFENAKDTVADKYEDAKDAVNEKMAEKKGEEKATDPDYTGGEYPSNTGHTMQVVYPDESM